MTKRREWWVSVLTVVLALVGLSCLIGCPPPDAREPVINYQEIAIIQLASRFIPTEIALVKGRPARLHVTNAFEQTTDFVVPALDIDNELRSAELTQIVIAPEQIEALNGKRFACVKTGNFGTFRVMPGGEPVPPVSGQGTREVAVVMTDQLAAPRTIILKRGVPVRLYVTKTKGEEEDDRLLIDAWGIKEDVEVGQITEIKLTPKKAGDVTFVGIITPSSRGTIRVID